GWSAQTYFDSFPPRQLIGAVSTGDFQNDGQRTTRKHDLDAIAGDRDGGKSGEEILKEVLGRALGEAGKARGEVAQHRASKPGPLRGGGRIKTEFRDGARKV